MPTRVRRVFVVEDFALCHTRPQARGIEFMVIRNTDVQPLLLCRQTTVAAWFVEKSIINRLFGELCAYFRHGRYN